jgi:hypothetical protein
LTYFTGHDKLVHEKEKNMKKTKKQEIIEFFTLHSYEEFDSDCLHRMFGPAFRSRVSEINRDNKTSLVIRQQKGDTAKSVYFADFVVDL